MILHQILLQILYKLKQERTISAAYHLLKGKRSGQTIQDVGIFQLYHYFGILPKLSREKYNTYIAQLVEAQYIAVYDDGHYVLTAQGEAVATQPFPYTFDSWHYRGNEHIFFARLSLIVQSLSYQRESIRAFTPIQRNEQIQQWVKQFLLRHHYQQKLLQRRLHDELLASLQALDVQDSQKQLIVRRLAGHQEPGYTWQQLAMQGGQTELDVQLLFISTLHTWIATIYEKQAHFPLLLDMLANVRIEQTLTSSTQQTAKLYAQGYSLQQISALRRLKMSTIEDHIVELAMHQLAFNLREFVSEADEQAVHAAIEAYQTKKLRVLKEAVPHLTYFQIRLIIARGGKSHVTR